MAVRIRSASNSSSLWAARTKRPPQPKTIDISFLGARRDYALIGAYGATRALARENIAVLVTGGRQETRCLYSDFFHILDHSLISLNFSRTINGISQIKASEDTVAAAALSRIATTSPRDILNRASITSPGSMCPSFPACCECCWKTERAPRPSPRAARQSSSNAIRPRISGMRSSPHSETPRATRCGRECRISPRFVTWLGLFLLVLCLLPVAVSFCLPDPRGGVPWYEARRDPPAWHPTRRRHRKR